ncbi:DUF805 domain-containing protein [Caulobacter sp. ErkDOM-E]|uniref:DUF805 domain-containing protein n=1 Tax=Caulobacter sp. ErkDOM-E TaxID=3402778 RepID=UPI003AF503D0
MTFENLKLYLAGRAGRSEYWIWMIGITLGTVALSRVMKDQGLVSLISALPWFIIASRRLRDFGMSGWWCLFNIGAGFVIGLLSAIANAIVGVADGEMVSPTLRMALIGITSWAFIIYVGSRRSLTTLDTAASASVGS